MKANIGTRWLIWNESYGHTDKDDNMSEDVSVSD